MNLCAISFKPCWRDQNGRWYAQGGFPLQMAAISSLFDQTELLVVEVPPEEGGLPLPPSARVIPLRQPAGRDLRRKLSMLANLPYFLSILWRHIRRADVVHTPVPGDIPLLGMLVALAQRKPLLVRYGGSWQDNDQQTAANRFTKALMRRAAGGRNVMLATGAGSEPPAEGVHWIFSTTLAQRELAGIHPQLDRGLSNPPRLVYVGRFSPEKGIPNLVRAIALLNAQGFTPMPQVCLVGDGPQRKEIEALVAELGVGAYFGFTGMLDRPGVHGELAQADLCVQPSLTEGFSKAWLDAMAHGLPVIASDVGAAAGVIGSPGERGWLVPPGDPAALAGQIAAVIGSPLDWAALRRRCRAFAEGYTLESWAETIGRICAEQWNVQLVGGKLTP